MAQVDHVVDARAEEIVGGGAGKQHGRTPRKQALLEIKLGETTIGNHPRSPVFMRLPGVVQGRLNKLVFFGANVGLKRHRYGVRLKDLLAF